MTGTDPHVLILVALAACTALSLSVSFGTWFTSRAKKVRLLEDQVVSSVRAQRERADQVELKLQEWTVTITGILAEVEEFFERSVKERKRAGVAATRAEQANQVGATQAFDTLSRSDQIDQLRSHFERRQ